MWTQIASQILFTLNPLTPASTLQRDEGYKEEERGCQIPALDNPSPLKEPSGQKGGKGMRYVTSPWDNEVPVTNDII